MRLESAHISNFKLLKDIDLKFSTEPDRPLTVVRAENGSGKTSTLQALRWGMWGEPGIPSGMSLTSTEVPAGEPITVQVRLDFTERDIYSDVETRYRIIRSCTETRGEGDAYARDTERVRLLQLTDSGDRDIEEGKQSRINAMLPLSLADVFFTDGDSVQSFVAGKSEADRQEYVHKAIRQLLGFDDVERAQELLDPISRKFRRELRASGSVELKNAEEALRRIENELAEKRAQRSQILDRISQADAQIREDERELDRLKGIGDLEAIQARIRQLETDMHHLESEESEIRQQMKDILQSEELSRKTLSDKLLAGIDVLAELTDRRIIPGISLGLLHDRLELGECICGVELAEGGERHSHVKDLIQSQAETEPSRERLTTLRHEARDIIADPRTGRVDRASLNSHLSSLKLRFTTCKDRQREKSGDLRAERDKRNLIDEDRVRELTSRLQSSREKKSEFERQRGEVEGGIHLLEERWAQQQRIVADAEKQEQLSDVLRLKSSIASDLLTLTTRTLDRLKSDHVQQVSERMNRMFMEIEGADTAAEANLYTGVSVLSGSYDVAVHSRTGRTLDVVTDLNGANKRVLTLSLIWALMEVAEKEAPRIIDTPIGMTSGSIKRRMVDLFTEPVDAAGMPYQVVLLMTRSEIRDIDDLVNRRAGLVTTLSCSKDYPIDLMNDWGVDYPVVRTCECSHTQFCDTCERRNDRGLLGYREVLN